MDWDDVEEAIEDAKALIWDGCHKIYVAMDVEQVRYFLKEGYGDGSDRSKLFYINEGVTTPSRMIEILKDWYDRSCELRFISAVRTTPNPNDGFTKLVEQFQRNPDGSEQEDGEEEDG